MSESSGRRELRSSLQFEGGGSYIGIHGNMRGWRCDSCLFVRFNQCLSVFLPRFQCWFRCSVENIKFSV